MPEPVLGAGNRAIAIWTCRQMNNGPSTRPGGDEGMPERTIVGKLKTDERGWPQIHFAPESDSLHALAAFLQEDVGIFLPACEDLLQAARGVLLGTEEESSWNGDRFLLRFRRDLVRMTDMYGDAGVNSAPVMIDTPLFFAIVDTWKDFVSDLPRQREFAADKSV